MKSIVISENGWLMSNAQPAIPQLIRGIFKDSAENGYEIWAAKAHWPKRPPNRRQMQRVMVEIAPGRFTRIWIPTRKEVVNVHRG